MADMNYMNQNAMGKDKTDSSERARESFKSKVRDNKRYKDLLGEYTKFEEMRLQIAKKTGLAELEERRRIAKAAGESTLEIDAEIALQEKQINQQAMDATLSYKKRTYEKATVLHKAQLKKQEADAIASDLKVKTQEYNDKWAKADSNTRRKLTWQHKKDVLQSVEAEKKARAQAIALEKSEQGKKYKELGKSIKDFSKGPTVKGAFEIAHQIAGIDKGTFESLISEQKKVVKAQEEAAEAAEANVDALLEAGFDENSDQVKAAKQEAEAARKQLRAEQTKQRYMENLLNAVNSTFDQVEDMLTTYKGHIDARLQGSDKNYKDVMDKIATNLAVSPFVRTKEVVEKMKELVDQGVAYNVEQRAFLGTISDKIANTFNAFDSNLLRLIRLQQADSTAARLGMEASLTKFFNGMFQDTSYLNDIYDQVSAAIIDANASMTRDMSAQFEYIVQKWLGSLSAVGMSSDTINQIATGLNYLATGDVTSLANNTQLQTLMAMSASKAGISYSDMLIKGLDASTTNKLLEGMMSYLKEIAENSDNQVVRAAYGDVFNLSMSDMKAISNLSSGDIANISGQTLSYSGMESELSNQFVKLLSRTSLTEMVSNAYNNAIFGVAEDMVNNPVTYVTMKMLEFMEDNNIDMNIPFVNAMGFGLDLNTSVQDLMNLGLQLTGAMSLIGNTLGSLGSLGGLNLNSWGAQEYTSRGSANAFTMGASQGDTTQSTYITTNNSSDMQNSTLNTATDDAENTKKITNKNNKSEHTFDEFYQVTIEGSKGSGWIRVEDTHVKKAFQGSGDNYLHTRDTRMKFKDSSLKTYDTNLAKVFGSTSVVKNSRWLNVYDNHLTDFAVTSGDSMRLAVYDYSLDKYNTAANKGSTLSVSDSSVALLLQNFTFDTGAVKAYVTNMISAPPSADSIATSIATKDLKVKSSSNNGLLVDINTASRNALKSASSVSISSLPTVDINFNYTKLATEILNALGKNSSDSRAATRTIGDLYALFSGDNADISAHVRVQNEDGQRLQVDTEADGSGYAFNADATNTLIW